MLVRACPICGIDVINHCFHDEETVLARDMSLDHATALLKDTIADMESAIDAYKDRLRRYEEMSSGVSNTREA